MHLSILLTQVDFNYSIDDPYIFQDVLSEVEVKYKLHLCMCHSKQHTEAILVVSSTRQFDIRKIWAHKSAKFQNGT